MNVLLTRNFKSNYFPIFQIPWWRHQMETFSALLAICAGIHRSPVNSTHKGQWRGALMFSLIYPWTNGCVNNREIAPIMTSLYWSHSFQCGNLSLPFVFQWCMRLEPSANPAFPSEPRHLVACWPASWHRKPDVGPATDPGSLRSRPYKGSTWLCTISPCWIPRSTPCFLALSMWQ